VDWDAFWSNVWPWVWPSAVLIAWWVGGAYLARRAVRFLVKRAENTDNVYDDVLMPRLHRPLQIGVLIIGLNLWAQLAPIPGDLGDALAVITKVGLITILLLVTDSAMQSWMVVRSRSSRVMATSGSVLRTTVRVVVFIVGTLMILSAVGIDVTPLVASLGVGSLAVGLALQKTLEDFVAGLLLAADQPVRIGDYIEVDGLEGTVLLIGWRSSRLVTRGNSHVIVPNSVLAQSRVVNRSRPNERVDFMIEVGVHYDSNLEHVGRCCVEEATALHRSDARATADYAPRALVVAFGASSIDFVVWCSAKSWLDHYGLKDEVMRAIRRRFAAEGITIPYPMRTLDVPPDSPLWRLSGPPAER